MCVYVRSHVYLCLARVCVRDRCPASDDSGFCDVVGPPSVCFIARRDITVQALFPHYYTSEGCVLFDKPHYLLSVLLQPANYIETTLLLLRLVHVMSRHWVSRERGGGEGDRCTLWQRQKKVRIMHLLRAHTSVCIGLK